MTTKIEAVQNRFFNRFILLMIAETIFRFTICLSYTDKSYAYLLACILTVSLSLYILYVKSTLKPVQITVLVLAFFFFTHYLYVMNAYSFISVMVLWFVIVPLAARVYFSNKISIIIFIIVTVFVVSMPWIIDFIGISSHYRTTVLESYELPTVEFIINFFIVIIFCYVILSLYYLVQILRIQYPRLAVFTGSPFVIQEKQYDPKQETSNESDLPQMEDAAYIQNMKEARLFSTYKSIMDYMKISECFLNPDYTLEQLANDMKINKSMLSGSLHRIGRISFKDLLNQYRIDRAKDLFRNETSNNIKQVCMNVGFKYHTTFNRVFKKQEGVTPSEYIINIRNKKNVSN